MDKKMNFEDAIMELGEIVKKLEKGDTTLEESLALFEKGVTMTKLCNKLLDTAEQKVNILLKTGSGDIAESQFKAEE